VVATYDKCKVIYSNGSTDAAPAPSLDGGAITVSGLSTPIELLTVPVPNGVHYQSGMPENQASVFGNNMIEVAASGGSEVPAWSTQVATPQPVSITKPKGGDIFTAIDKNKALPFQWNAGNGNAVNIHLFVVTTSGDQVAGNTVNCTLDADTGAYTVPASAMSMLPNGGGGLFPDKLLVFAVSRITNSELSLPGNTGTASVVAIRTSADGAGLN